MAANGETLTEHDIRRRIQEAADTVPTLLVEHEWFKAAAATEHVRGLKPDDEKVIELVRKVERARGPHKQYLQRQFLAASRKQDYDRAMVLLKEMDQLLTRDEAAPMMELARDVIEKARENFSQRFRMAVNQQDWVEATHIAEIIISEFRNTRMAQEASEKLTQLRERSRRQRTAARR